ncbi:hypothetical protein AZL_a01860 (plasmid) [Azospirillum sp. B510]|uniref:nitroreductase n=1 Tax=Azospirillum sp. (strain B510) TaxID=137722 RepID=UPI0001C4B946|nr:nitroreductase [Azospirillum sp. B510]BAI73717.1 hypothetical protein AZL_a01860 [Azospirillum sp. B510]
MSDHDLDTLLRTRRSVRAFLNRPVPDQLVRECLDLAQTAPSNCNAQPWRVHLASGEARDRLAMALGRAFDAQENETIEHPMEVFTGEYHDLQVACAIGMYDKMGIKRADRVARRRAHARNFAFFDAPHAAIVCMDKSFGVGAALDIGIWVQTFLLALTSRGIQSCTQASIRSYPHILRDVLNIPAELTPLCAIAFGYEDPSNPINTLKTARNGLDGNITMAT